MADSCSHFNDRMVLEHVIKVATEFWLDVLFLLLEGSHGWYKVDVHTLLSLYPLPHFSGQVQGIARNGEKEVDTQLPNDDL